MRAIRYLYKKKIDKQHAMSLHDEVIIKNSLHMHASKMFLQLFLMPTLIIIVGMTMHAT